MIELIVFVFGICGISYVIDKCGENQTPQNENIDKML